MAKHQSNSPLELRDAPTSALSLYSEKLVHSLQGNVKKLSLQGLSQYYCRIEEEQKEQTMFGVLSMLGKLKNSQVIVFVRNPQRCEELRTTLINNEMLQKTLTNNETIAISIDSCQKREERIKTFKDFENNRIPILVCNTNTFGRGINLASVGLIINYDMAPVAGAYFDRVGHEEGLSRHGYVMSFISSDADLTVLHSLQNDYDVSIARNFFTFC